MHIDIQIASRDRAGFAYTISHSRLMAETEQGLHNLIIFLLTAMQAVLSRNLISVRNIYIKSRLLIKIKNIVTIILISITLIFDI